jgi:hypothetical protein
MCGTSPFTVDPLGVGLLGESSLRLLSDEERSQRILDARDSCFDLVQIRLKDFVDQAFLVSKIVIELPLPRLEASMISSGLVVRAPCL